MSTMGSYFQVNTITIKMPQYSTYQSTNAQVVWESEALSLIMLPVGWEFAPGYRLVSILPVQLQISTGGVLATTYLETEEYGWGSTESEAIKDLMSSLVEYMKSLESRQERLSEKALFDLNKLHQLIQR